MAAKRQSLGTGLDALLGLAEEGSVETAEAADLKEVDGSLKQLPLEFLQRGKYQPRRDLDADALKELASSISKQGVMQPIVVRKINTDKYEIIAGERSDSSIKFTYRFHASRGNLESTGTLSWPVLIRTSTPPCWLLASSSVTF